MSAGDGEAAPRGGGRARQVCVGSAVEVWMMEAEEDGWTDENSTPPTHTQFRLAAALQASEARVQQQLGVCVVCVCVCGGVLVGTE